MLYIGDRNLRREWAEDDQQQHPRGRLHHFWAGVYITPCFWESSPPHILKVIGNNEFPEKTIKGGHKTGFLFDIIIVYRQFSVKIYGESQLKIQICKKNSNLQVSH